MSYCLSKDNCDRAEDCKKADWLIREDNEEYEEYEPESCQEFECNCSQVRYIGSNKHGSYYRCSKCGVEEEG